MKIGKFLFRYRSLTPVPIIIVLLVFAKPSTTTIIIGFFVSVCGEIIRFISVGYTGITTRSKKVSSDSLVTNGPYGYMRNPIYLGNLFISFGVVVSANTFSPWFIMLYIILFTIQYSFIIKHEEKFLKEKFTKDFARYVDNVPSFFPGLKFYKEGSSVKPDFKKALISERTTILIVSLLYIIIYTIYLFHNHFLSL